jgi:urease accessory protein
VIRVDLDARGIPVLSRLRCQVPLVARRTGDPPRADGRDGVTVHLVAAAAGPLAGDQLELAVEVGPGARLTLRSAAATVALPGRGPGPSRLLVRASVDAGGLLEYLPEPTVAAAGCDHRMRAEIRLAVGAAVVWREELLLGRHGEAGGRVSAALHVDTVAPDEQVDWWTDGRGAGHGTGGHGTGGAPPRPLLRHDLATGPGVPGATGPAVLGSARAVGTVLVARGAGPAGLGAEAWAGVGTAVLPLAGPGVLVTALADDAVTLRRRLTAGEKRAKNRVASTPQ